jgi:hypothetical protein
VILWGIVGNILEYSVFNISNLYTTKSFDLYENGLFLLNKLDDSKLNSNQILQVTSELNKTTYIDKDNITQF